MAASQTHAYFNPFDNANVQKDSAGSTASRPPIPPAHQADDRNPQPLHISYNSTDTLELPIQGQGTIAVSATNASQIVILLSSKDDSTKFFNFVLSGNGCYFSTGADYTNGPKIDGVALKDGLSTGNHEQIKRSCYLRPETNELYWLSLDRNNGLVRFGKKYLNAGLTLYESKLKAMSPHGIPEWIDQSHAFLDHVDRVQVLQTGGDQDAFRVVVQPLPIVTDLPPFVISNQSITLDDLANGIYTVPENLPIECQKLYHNVSGPNIKLDTEDFPDFSAAIQRSINTPGLIGHNLLKRKSHEFGRENMDGTYLRITLGHDVGDSPGPPYVLEIWPAKHYSPIHDHGNSFAVIRVLHGNISAYFYDSLDLRPRVLGPPARLKKGDVTWMSNKNYQVHQLYNESEDGTVCCTIQCYKYGEKDKKHDEYFEYLADIDGDSQPDKRDVFKPNSDYEFNLFKQNIKKEWEAREQ